jgi:hypothetical protein
MNMQLPEMSTSRPVLLALAAHARPANPSAEVYAFSYLFFKDFTKNIISIVHRK